MTFILTCLSDDKIDLQLANRLWRPIATEIKRSGLISHDRANNLAHHMCTPISRAEATAIADHLTSKRHEGSLSENIDRHSAANFAEFARSSFGFEVC